MTWIKSLSPTVAAAIISAVVSLVVAVITSLLAPTVKYGLDRRLERRKLELAYVAEQSKALRDRIGFHKGTILSAAADLASRMRNYRETLEAPKWLRGRGYYIRTFAFRILTHWYALICFSREAVYIDASVATKGDWAFVKAVKLNLDTWSEVGLFEGLGYSGNMATDHFFSGQIISLVNSFTNPESNKALTWPEFEQLLKDGTKDFDRIFNYLSQVQRTAWQLKYQRLVASHLVLAATLNSFGYDHQRISTERVQEISSHCGSKVKNNLRQMILDLRLEEERGFRDLARVLEGSRFMTGTEGDVRMHEIRIHAGNRRLAGRVFEPRPPTKASAGEKTHGALLFVHGRKSNQVGYATRAEAASLNLGVTCLTFDLGGHGDSTGNLAELSRSDHLEDLTAAYDWLKSATGVDPTRIGVCGASYGAFITCLLIGKRPVKRLLLRAPWLYDDEKSRGSLEKQQEKLSELASTTALRNLQNFGGRTLVLESGADEVISHAVIERYLAAGAQVSHHTIDGATHRLTREEWKAAFNKEILEWFKDL